MRALVALAVVALAILGALLHPLALLLDVLPVNSNALQAFLTSTKFVIADVLGWAVVALLVVMLALVVRGRLAPRPGGGSHGSLSPLSSARMTVGIIAYNEAEAIARLVHDFRAQPGVVDVIVIDNNSSDGTADLAIAAGARVVHESKQGYGYACIRALREGALVPEADVVVLVEGDATFAPADIAKFQAYIGQADLVVGTRVIRSLVEDGSQMDYFFTWGNIAVATLLRLRFWHPQFLGAASISDVGCTYRAIRKQALERILPDLVVGTNHFSPHMILVSLDRGLSLIEIPVTLHRRIGVSKGAGRSFWAGLGVGIVMIWHIITYSPKRRRSQTSEVQGQQLIAKP
jgi:glycosyltransferase involved in cell wall biosynthesis